MYGNSTNGIEKLDESSLMKPVSVYGISKKAAQELCNMYRDAYGMFIVSSILFNHESDRRGHTFVTQKIVDYVAKFKHFSHENMKPLELGNLNAKRDWGSSKIYMEAVYSMLQMDTPENLVIATGETHSVREFVEIAFQQIGIDILWIGNGLNEIGINKITGKTIIKVNKKYYRDIDIECLIGNPAKAKQLLGWTYTMTFKELVIEMVNAGIKRLK
jgi:GDPmannose 4,6-dehydratase